ncbi:hypothetical protein EV360DRAFT_75087 [Lentinula raphanica]|nr:hypothetical protein EV360DRAFT_75087 [Lentinula raphanica]
MPIFASKDGNCLLEFESRNRSKDDLQGQRSACCNTHWYLLGVKAFSQSGLSCTRSSNSSTSMHLLGIVYAHNECVKLVVSSSARSSASDDRTMQAIDKRKNISVKPSAPFDISVFSDICISSATLKRFQNNPAAWNKLVQHTWVYARVSPSQREHILTTLKSLVYITLMVGDGMNDVIGIQRVTDWFRVGWNAGRSAAECGEAED